MRQFSANLCIVIFAVLANLVRSDDTCQKINTQYYEVKCSSFNTNLRILCHSDLWTNFLVKFDLPKASEIRFENCRLPETKSVGYILKSMNIIVNQKVAFVDLRSIPNRKNLQNLSVTELSFVAGNLTRLPSDLLYDVPKLEKLSIVNTNLSSIPGAFFLDWAKNIRQVDLSHNHLRKIAKNDFAKLVNLTILDLSSNDIDYVEQGAFDSLRKLNEIKFANNRLHTLPFGIFHRLTVVTDINLSGNSFDELPQDLLKTTSNLKSFTMTGNSGNLKTLSNGFFKNLTHLEEVHLEDNHLESVPLDIFTGCSNLKNIYLHNNLLVFLPSYIFQELHQLKKLRINNNKLTALGQNVFEGLQSVEDFDASNNNITRIDSGFVTLLKSAIFVNLSHNRLTFENPDKIKASETPTAHKLNLDPSVKLKNILLSNNSIAQFNDDVINMLQYSKLIDLRNNHISKINISELSARLAVRNSTKKPNEYITVYLNQNPLNCDCNIIDFSRYLDAQRKGVPNNIFAFGFYDEKFTCASPPEFVNQDVRTFSLEDLYCSLESSDPNDACNATCACREYPEKQLLYVDCSHRNLTRAPLNIKNINNWSIELNMTGNMLMQAPSLIGSNLTNVTSLDLSNNNITKVTLGLFSPTLQYLKLNNNSISRLDSDIIEYLSQNNTFRNITLYGNKWTCDCRTQQFYNFVQNTLTKYSLKDVTCYGTHKKLYELPAKEICSNTVAIVIVVLLIVLCGIAAVGLYLKYRRGVRSYLKV